MFNTVIYMSILTRKAKSFTVDPEILDYVQETKGDSSASERVNELLRRAILEEQYERLEKEAARFYGKDEDREHTRAFQKASIRSIARD